ncbi:MAG: hypothetical protein QM528_09150 [Phycisphaerales bacterium]|nr:hypothetical protein [Phycisphaerales bacterium]
MKLKFKNIGLSMSRNDVKKVQGKSSVKWSDIGPFPCPHDGTLPDGAGCCCDQDCVPELICCGAIWGLSYGTCGQGAVKCNIHQPCS